MRAQIEPWLAAIELTTHPSVLKKSQSRLRSKRQQVKKMGGGACSASGKGYGLAAKEQRASGRTRMSFSLDSPFIEQLI